MDLPVSPDRTMATYRLLNTFGCLAMAADSDWPRSTSSRISLIADWRMVESVCCSRMDRAFRIGRPELASPTGDIRLALPTTIAVEIWRVAPLVTFLLLPGFASIPGERWEDATLSGASWMRTALDVVVPALRPLLLAITMLLIGLSLGTFDAVLILTGGGPGTSTVTPALYSYNQAFGANNWPLGAASAWLIAAGVLGAGLVYVGLARSRAS